MNTTVCLSQGFFESREMIFVEHGELTASTFRFPSGVCAVRLRNSLGEMVLLPYQGQQIWDASMCGRRLTMKSMFDQPYPTRDFLSTYGGFLLHCGATAMGAPGPEDTHPLHGELHNAPYQTASLVLGSDDTGSYIGLTGSYRHTVAFNYNYTATPLVKLYASESVFSVSMEIQNLKNSPMPLMFLEHINFVPVNGGRLLQTVHCDPQNMWVRANIPPFMDVAPGYREFVQKVQEDPSIHLEFKPELVYDPEMVLFMNYLSGTDGWARTMQIHPDGTADLVRHRPAQLTHGVRWICRTADQDAIGIEPCTAQVEGFTNEKKKGNVRSLPGGGKYFCELEIGVLGVNEVAKEVLFIDQTLAGETQ